MTKTTLTNQVEVISMTATTITWQSLDQIFFNEKWGEVQLINDPVKDCRVTVRKKKK